MVPIEKIPRVGNQREVMKTVSKDGTVKKVRNFGNLYRKLSLTVL